MCPQIKKDLACIKLYKNEVRAYYVLWQCAKIVISCVSMSLCKYAQMMSERKRFENGHFPLTKNINATRDYRVRASTVFADEAAGIVGRLVHISALCSLSLVQ